MTGSLLSDTCCLTHMGRPLGRTKIGYSSRGCPYLAHDEASVRDKPFRLSATIQVERIACNPCTSACLGKSVCREDLDELELTLPALAPARSCRFTCYLGTLLFRELGRARFAPRSAE